MTIVYQEEHSWYQYSSISALHPMLPHSSCAACCLDPCLINTSLENKESLKCFLLGFALRVIFAFCLILASYYLSLLSSDPDTSNASVVLVLGWRVMVPFHTRAGLERQQLLPGMFSSFCFDGRISVYLCVHTYLN